MLDLSLRLIAVFVCGGELVPKAMYYGTGNSDLGIRDLLLSSLTP